MNAGINATMKEGLTSALLQANLLRSICLLIPVTLILSSCVQPQTAGLKLSVIEKGPVNSEGITSNLLVNINLSSNHLQTLKVPDPQNLFINEIDMPLADGYVDVRTATPDGKDSTVTVTNDADYVNVNIPAKTLSPGQSINYTFNLGYYYQFVRNHEYHIRLWFKLSRLNPCKDVHSDWLTVRF
jgi:hypothetical protein